MKRGDAKKQPTELQGLAGLVIPWPALTLSLAILTMTSIGTLVVVTSIQDIDTLSTVALALAVLAFAAQLIVTMAQSSQSAKLNSETMSALADLRAASDSLLSNQKGHFETVLRAALQSAVPAAVEDVRAASADDAESAEPESEDSSEDRALQAESLGRALEARLAEAITSFEVTPTARSRQASSQQRAQVRRKAFARRLQSFPSKEEGEAVLQIVRSLGVREVANLGRIISRVLTQGDGELAVTYNQPEGRVGASTQKLIDCGLIEAMPSGDRRGRYRLTDRGLIAAQLLRAQGPVPEWAQDLA